MTDTESIPRSSVSYRILFDVHAALIAPISHIIKFSSGFEQGRFPLGGYQLVSAYNSLLLFQTLIAKGCITTPHFALENTRAIIYL